MRKYQIATLLAYLIATITLIALTVHATDGNLIYTLDDPYIHLAVAENILRGGYGVNLTEFSSPSSSILYPFLLTLPMMIGIADWGPLLIGIIANTFVIWLMAGFFWRYAISSNNEKTGNLIFIISVPFLLLSINAEALPLTGMEHPIHVLGSVLVIIGLVDMVQQNRVPVHLLSTSIEIFVEI